MAEKRIRRYYSKLEGRTVRYYNGDKSTECIVTGSDYSIGLTLQTNDTAREYKVCVAGPKSPLRTKMQTHGHKWSRSIHHRSMTFIYDHVMAGQEIVAQELVEYATVGTISRTSRNPSAKTCSFSQ